MRDQRFRRLFAASDNDPLSGMANLFDIAMVFAVALLIALVSRVPMESFMKPTSAADRIPVDSETLPRFKVGQNEVGGEGKRLGVAYQLETGEVIYVP